MAIAYTATGQQVGVATETSGAACSPLSPSTVNAGDILIIHTYFEGTATAPDTPSGFTLLDGPRVIESTISRHWIYGKVADGTEDGAANALGSQAVTTMRSGRVYRFTGRISGAIADLVNGFSATSHATDPQMPSVTTTAAGALACACVAQNDNNALAAATGMSGGTWAEATAEFVAALAPGLVLQLQTCTPTADPGTVSGGAVAAANDPSGVIGFQIRDSAPVILTPSGVVHTRAFGTAKINHTLTANAPVIHARAFGTPVLPKRGFVAWVQMQVPPEAAQAISPTGVAHSRGFGTAVVVRGAVIVAPSSVAHSRTIPSPVIVRTIHQASVVHARVIGTAVVVSGVVTIVETSVIHTRAFGTAKINQTLTTTAVVHTRAFGTATVGGVFPSVAFSAGTQITADTASPHTVTMPTGIQAGHRLLAFFVVDGDHNISWPAGWTEIGQLASGGTVTGSVAERIADGGEGSTIQVSFDGGISEESVCMILRVVDVDSAQASEVASASGSSTSPDPPVLNPTGWDIRNTLWIVFIATDNSVEVTASPTNYTTIDSLNSGGATGVGLGWAVRQLAAASENPDTGTIASSDDWAAFTVAVTPQGEAAQQIAPSGVVHTRAFGTAVVTRGAVSITPSGVVHARAFGTAAINARRGLVAWVQLQTPAVLVTILPSSVIHTRAFGTAKVYSSRITPTGVVHTRAFGTTNVIGTQAVAPVSVIHTRAFGTTFVGLEPRKAAAGFIWLHGDVEFGLLEVPSVIHSRAIGTARLRMMIVVPSVVHTRAFGTTIIGAYIIPFSVIHIRDFGLPQLNHNLTASSVIHTRGFGGPTVGHGLTLVQTTSVVHGRTFGTAVVTVSVFTQFIITSSVIHTRNITGPLVTRAGDPAVKKQGAFAMEWGVDTFHPGDVEVEVTN